MYIIIYCIYIIPGTWYHLLLGGVLADVSLHFKCYLVIFKTQFETKKEPVLWDMTLLEGRQPIAPEKIQRRGKTPENHCTQLTAVAIN